MGVNFFSRDRTVVDRMGNLAMGIARAKHTGKRRIGN